jgi:voltage-gated sodium channel
MTERLRHLVAHPGFDAAVMVAILANAVAAFIILNVLIGVVLNSMEEARQIHVEQELREQGLEPTDEEVDVMSRIRRLREAIDELEDELKLSAGSRQRP